MNTATQEDVRPPISVGGVEASEVARRSTWS